MEIEKLIEQLNDWNENLISELCADDKLTCDDLCDGKDCIVVRAATALSTLQSENEKLRAELEQVRREKDAAVECCRGYCESCAFERDCAKHDMNDAAPTRWYYGDCEDWEWRGPEDV